MPTLTPLNTKLGGKGLRVACFPQGGRVYLLLSPVSKRSCCGLDGGTLAVAVGATELVLLNEVG